MTEEKRFCQRCYPRILTEIQRKPTSYLKFYCLGCWVKLKEEQET